MCAAEAPRIGSKRVLFPFRRKLKLINDPPKAERVYVTVQRPNIDPKQLQDELQRVLDEVGERIRKLEN